MADKKTTVQKPASFNLFDFINSNTQIVLFLLLGIICFIVFKDFIFFKKVYLFKDIGSDTLTLYYPLLSGFSDLMKTEGIPYWSFAQGLGQNIFPNWLSDVFAVFLSFFSKSQIPYGLAYLEILKIILIGFVFYKFLKELKLSNYVCLMFALLYSFSGFIIMGGSWYIYSIEALYVSIILFGFERWLNHKKYFWFVIGISLLTFLQPSYLFPYSLFFGCYFIARYFDVRETGGKDFIFFLSKTVALAVLGVAISGYQLLPDILQIIESPRVGGESGLFEKLKATPMFSFADEGLRFTTVFRSFGTDMLGNGSNFQGWQNYLEAPVFYCGILCLVLFPQFFVSLNKSQKKAYGIVTFLFCLPILFPYFRYLFWAFSGDYFRTFSNVVVLFLVIYSARALDFIIKKQKVNKIALLVSVLFLLFLIMTPAGQWKSWVNQSMRNVMLLLILAYGFFIFRLSNAKAVNNTLKTLFLFICVIELIYSTYYTVNDRQALRNAEITEKVGYNDYTIECVNYLNQNDKSFFRINKDFGSSPTQHMSLNEGKVQGYYGTGSYHSFNQKNYIKFLGAFKVINPAEELETRWAKGLVDRPILFSLVNGKYWITRRTDNAIAGMGFDSIANFVNLKIYKNRYNVPFGVTYDKIMSEDDLKKLSNIQKDFAALRACVISNEDLNAFNSMPRFNLADTNSVLSYDNLGLFVKNLKQDSLVVTKFSNNHITGNINASATKILFLSFPYDEGWSAKINNNEAKLFKVHCGLTGMMVNKGANSIELKFEPRLKDKGAMLSFAGLFALLGLIGFSKLRKTKSES